MRLVIPAQAVCAVWIALGFAAFSQLALAKCDTDRIEISGETLGKPISISDPEITGQFFVYNGPGVSVNGHLTYMDPNNQTGSFIYWPSGYVDDVSMNSETFAVSFFCKNNGTLEAIYEIDYRFRIGDESGYVFLPGAGDSRYYRNISTIIHDVEGNWFHSTDAWERTIRPIIEKAIQN